MFARASVAFTASKPLQSRLAHSIRSMASLPVILCGATERIGTGVIEGLKPEYEVIHFVMNGDAGAAEIPALLRGEKPPSDGSALGSKDYSRTAAAVITGGAFDDTAFAKMKDAVDATAGTRKVPWLRPDLTKPAPPLGPEYGKAMVARVREALKALADEGKMDSDIVHWF